MASAVARLAVGNKRNQVNLAAAGAILPLVTLLGYNCVETQEWAARALHNLALGTLSNQARIRRAGAVPALERLPSDAVKRCLRSLGEVPL